MSHYSKHGKIMDLLLVEDFMRIVQKMPEKTRRQRMMKAFIVLLYFTGVRVGELARARKSQFKVKDTLLFFEVGPREKTLHKTPPIQIPTTLAFMDLVVKIIKYTRGDEKVFPIHRATAWRYISRYFKAYPHYFRLNRITQFLSEGFSLPEVMTWSGHKTLSGINPYVGYVSITKLGQSLKRWEP